MPIAYKMLLEITKSKPSVIIHAFCKLQEADPTMSWITEVINLRKNKNSIVPAVKLYREKTGVGLRQAKEAIDKYDKTGILEV